VDELIALIQDISTQIDAGMAALQAIADDLAQLQQAAGQEETDEGDQADADKINAVQLGAGGAGADMAGKSAKIEQLSTKMAEIEQSLAPLVKAKKDAEAALKMKQMETNVSNLMARFGGQHIGGDAETRTARKFAFNINHGAEPEVPLAVTLWRARKWYDPEAIAKLHQWRSKALNEGAGASGGFLVPPQYMQDLVELRRASAPLRDIVTVMQVNSTSLLVPQQTGASTVAWVAEDAPKPSSDATFGQITVNIFTVAGIAKVSNQMLEDSSPAVDQIMRNDLGKSLGIEEDRVMWNGTGTGQPLGILKTGTITTTPASAQTAVSIYDDTLAAIGRFQGAYFGNPEFIAMHPRTYVKMLGAKDTANRFLGIGTVVAQGTMDVNGAPTGMTGAVRNTLFGIPLLLDANIPTAQTVGGNSDRSSIIVGAFKEAWLLERQGINIDVSSEAGTSFEQNQTWFRGEERIGFTAARQPTAFQVVSDVGP
jgi:HK97 family phage major capsid protein